MIALNNTGVIFGIVLLTLAGCVDTRDPDVSAFIKYNDADISIRDFSALSADEKSNVFFGAMKVHPPALSIEDELAEQDVAYLLRLKAEIEHRGGSYEAYSFITAVAKKQRAGQLTPEQVDAMTLDKFCHDRGDIQNLCSNVLMRLPANPSVGDSEVF